MMIRATDRINTVLAQDERLIDVFVGVSPAFVRLRSPVLRRTMTRMVTVEQAARIAGVDADHLLERLNRALTPASHEPGVPPPDLAPPQVTTGTSTGTVGIAGPIPTLLRDFEEQRIVDVDVRDDLRSGREPLRRIMEARRSLRPGEVLRLRAIFEPVPLYSLLARQGLDHWTERLADDDWQVWFYPASTRESVGPRHTASVITDPAPPSGAAEEVLDVRGLEPPEPMLRTLAALDRLPPGRTLVQLNVRVPQFLLPRLEEQGFEWEINQQTPELVRLLIRRRADH